jgi:hypothetical protein
VVLGHRFVKSILRAEVQRAEPAERKHMSHEKDEETDLIIKMTSSKASRMPPRPSIDPPHSPQSLPEPREVVGEIAVLVRCQEKVTLFQASEKW